MNDQVARAPSCTWEICQPRCRSIPERSIHTLNMHLFSPPPPKCTVPIFFSKIGVQKWGVLETHKFYLFKPKLSIMRYEGKKNLSNQIHPSHPTNVKIDFTSYFLQIGKQLSTIAYQVNNDPLNHDVGDRFYLLACKSCFTFTTLQYYFT